MWGYGPFSWHHDVNVEVNKLKLNIQRTVVVKISKGKSYREIAGYKVLEYNDATGSWISFRSAAVHQSGILIEGDDIIKLVFFLGLRDDIE